MRISKEEIHAFQKAVWRHYRMHGRHALPWRRTRDPYKILVSEIMLQQTQADRVAQKYSIFVKTFPNFRALNRAPFKEVLRMWQGLGYNRRAMYLKKIAEQVHARHHGVLPRSPHVLRALPGIGRYTASALSAFAWNEPAAFLETNIRTVFLHHFFKARNRVRDDEITDIIEHALDRRNPREWYWALMDYGAMLKAAGVVCHRKSAHYRRQSRFRGSNRERRGAILRLLLHGPAEARKIKESLRDASPAIKKVLDALAREGLIQAHGRQYAVRA